MEFKYTDDAIYNITLALCNKNIIGIFDPKSKALALIKDYMHGAPVWRRPNKKEIQEWNKRRKKNEI